MILCSNPLAQYLKYRGEIDDAAQRVFQNGFYILGEEVKAFEAEFARYTGVSHGVGTGSGTEAIHLALAACGIGQGNEVITVSHTAVATVAAIELSGATPVFVDIEPDSYTLDPARLEAVITSRTRAVVPVHLYGQPACLGPVLETAKKHGLRVIEDCAQAHGAMYKGRRVGSLGDMGCFSFYPTKNLGALGDGGMVVTNDDALAQKAKQLREYGWVERYVSHFCGWNTRLDEVQAAILRVKLKYLDRDNEERAQLAALYHKALQDTSLVLPERKEYGTHVYHLYVVRSTQRDALQTFLKTKGIGALVHYPVPAHLQPAYKGRILEEGGLPETERAAREVLSLPMYPELSKEDVRMVCDAVKEFKYEGEHQS